MYHLLSVDFLCSQKKLHICKTAAGLYHSHNEKQDEQGKSYRLYRTVDIYNHSPNAAALEVLRRGRDELPYFSEFLIPSFKGVLKVLNNPVIAHKSAPPSKKLWVSLKQSRDTLFLASVSQSARNQGKDFLCEGDDNAARQSQKGVCSLRRIVRFQAQSHLNNTEAEQDKTDCTN